LRGVQDGSYLRISLASSRTRMPQSR
jgi:hypothetical protein